MNKRKKILIITYYYKHKNAMASVRAIKLAKYFSKAGFDVTVLTSNQKDTWTQNYLEPVEDPNIEEIYAPEIGRWTKIKNYLDKRKKKGLEKKTTNDFNLKLNGIQKKISNNSFKIRLKKYLSWQFYFNIAKQEDICMFKGLKSTFKCKLDKKFDVVIATYPTYGAFLMGMWLKRKGYCKQLIADFRDPLYNPGFRDRKEEALYDFKCLQRILKITDQVVCVSKGIADGIKNEIPNFIKPLHIITNGYDLDDISSNECNISFEKNKINFVYTGTLYHGKRCVNMLASVLKELIQEGKIKKDSFKFQYAGPDFSELINQLYEYGLENTVINNGFVSREKAIAMQKAADALLLLTWNEKGYQGVIPGKLFEYMSIKGVPIIALVTGDVINSEVATLIRNTHTGCVCEQVSKKDRDTLKEYVEALFDHKILWNGNVEQFDYKIISQKYLSIM